jgi:hypothetical protein
VSTTKTTWTDAVSYARELIDLWARNDQWNECDELSHEIENAGALAWGEAFMEAAQDLDADISDLVDVAEYLAEHPQHIGVISDEDLRALMGEDAPDSL